MQSDTEDYPVTINDEPAAPTGRNDARWWVVIGVLTIVAVLALGLFALTMTGSENEQSPEGTTEQQSVPR